MPEISSIDTYGDRITEKYSLILTDPTFERRLKNFDPNLRLMFDQTRKRWTVLEWAPDNSGWNCLIVAEEKDGEPKALGEWVFAKLYVKRHNYENKMKMGADAYFQSLIDKANLQKAEMQQSASSENQDMIKDDIFQWRKVAASSPADATAGYRKF